MSSKYEMWLTYNAEKNKIKFPVLPEKITIKNGGQNASVNIVGLGEITIRRERKALTYSFSSFLPKKSFPGMSSSRVVTTKKVKKKKKTIKKTNINDTPKPNTIIKKISNWKEKKKPVHFMITGGLVDCYCTIESFSYEEAGGDVGTYRYSIELKEYREVEVRKIRKKKKKAKKTNKASKKKKAKVTKKKTTKRTNSKAIPDTYIVKKGDSLWNLAKKFYGDISKYRKIYNANKKIIGSNPNKIRPGQMLKIPN